MMKWYRHFNFLVFYTFLFVVLCTDCAFAQQGDDQSLQKTLDAIQVPQLKFEYNEFISTYSTYTVFQKKKIKPDLVIQLKESLILRGIDLVKKLRERSVQVESNSNLSAEAIAISEVLKELVRLQTHLVEHNVRFLHVGDSVGGERLTFRNIQEAVFHERNDATALAARFQVGMSDSARWKSRLWRMKASAINGATHFGESYSAFLIATGLLTFVQLATNYESNPVALDQYIHHSSDLLGGVSFMAFTATSWVVSQQLYKIKNGLIPKSLIPYIGMTAGFLASSLFYELFSDVQLRKCVSSQFSDDASCDAAFDAWVVSNKIQQYTPAIIGLTSSAFISGALTASAVKAIKNIGEKSIFKGLWMGPQAEVAKKIGTTVFKNRYLMSVGTFVVFLAVDHQLTPRVQKADERLRLSWFDYKAWLDKKYFHRDYWRKNPDEPLFYVQDVFDVEATNLPEAQRYLDELIFLYQTNQWISTGPSYQLSQCYIDGLKLLEKRYRKKDEAYTQALLRKASDGSKMIKPESMIRCEVLSQPNRLISRYNEVQEKWRTYLLSDFYKSLFNWMEWIDQFSTDYVLTYKFYEKIMQMRQDYETTGQKPDLSQQALMQIVQKVMSKSNDNETSLVVADSSQLETKLNTLLKSMACGPTPRQIAKVSSGVSLVQMLYDKIWGAENYDTFKTALGSAAKFTAPSVIGPFRKSPCAMKKISIETNLQAGPEAFLYQWQTESQKIYPNLAELVFDQLDPAIWKSEKTNYSRFNQWWIEQVKNPVGDVWAYYEKQFKQMYYQKFIPSFFGKTDGSQVQNGTLDSYFDELQKNIKSIESILSLIRQKQSSAVLDHYQIRLDEFKSKLNQFHQQALPLAQHFQPRYFFNHSFTPEDQRQIGDLFSSLQEDWLILPTTLEIFKSILQHEDISSLSDDDFKTLLKEKISPEELMRLMTLDQWSMSLQRVFLGLIQMSKMSQALDFEASPSGLKEKIKGKSLNPLIRGQ